MGRPTNQDVTYKGKTIKKGVQLWPVGTEIIKSSIMARLNNTDKGPGSIHFPMAFAENDEYFKQVTGEQLVTEFKKGVPRKVWKQIYHNVEALDCFVYAYAAAVLKGLSRMTDDVKNPFEKIRIPASEVLHAFKLLKIGHVRRVYHAAAR